MKNTLVIGERYRCDLEKSLADLRIEVYWMPDNPRIDYRLAGHADLSAIRLGNKIIASKHLTENDTFVNFLTYKGYNILPMAKEQGRKYPDDAGLCACVAGGRLIHNLRYTDPVILENFQSEKIHVNQGYTKCSCCMVGTGTMISADCGVESTVRKHGIEVLKINSKYIVLDGFGYGFIGGASIVLDEAVLFTGRFSDEHDTRSIESVIRDCGKLPIYLSHRSAFDIGSALVL